MKCKFCNSEIDHLGSEDYETCSWCIQEVPMMQKTCYKCGTSLVFEHGIAICSNEHCIADYITEEGHKYLNGEVKCTV